MSRPTQGYAGRRGACRYGAVTLCRRPFQALPVRSAAASRGPTTPDPPRRTRFRLIPFRSPLLWKSMFLSLPAGTKMFQFPAFAPLTVPHLQCGGFPHSESRGSAPVCGSPRIFAACHVLHSRRKPRHPPYALLVLFSESRRGLLSRFRRVKS